MAEREEAARIAVSLLPRAGRQLRARGVAPRADEKLDAEVRRAAAAAWCRGTSGEGLAAAAQEAAAIVSGRPCQPHDGCLEDQLKRPLDPVGCPMLCDDTAR